MPNIIIYPHIQYQIDRGYRIVNPQSLQVGKEYIIVHKKEQYSNFFFRVHYMENTPTGRLFMRPEGPRKFKDESWVYLEEIPPINEEPLELQNVMVPIIENNDNPNEDPGQVGGRRRKFRKSRKSVQRKRKTQKRKDRKYRK